MFLSAEAREPHLEKGFPHLKEGVPAVCEGVTGHRIAYGNAPKQGIFGVLQPVTSNRNFKFFHLALKKSERFPRKSLLRKKKKKERKKERKGMSQLC